MAMEIAARYTTQEPKSIAQAAYYAKSNGASPEEIREAKEKARKEMNLGFGQALRHKHLPPTATRAQHLAILREARTQKAYGYYSMEAAYAALAARL